LAASLPLVTANTCVVAKAGVPGIQLGDRPIVHVAADLEAGLIAEPVLADTQDKLSVRLCNMTAVDIPGAPHTYGYLVLR
jgi:hypothetical protein